MSLFLFLLACGIPSVPVEEAATTPMLRQRTIQLTGGEVRADLSASWSRSCSPTGRMPGRGQTPCQPLFVGLAPVVPSGWRPKQPVTAWVTCSSAIKQADECEALLAAQTGTIEGRVLSLYDSSTPTSGWEKAIANASTRHGLSSVEKAPVILISRP